MSDSTTNISAIISEKLSATPFCFIATVGGTEPHVRAFQYQFEHEGKLWFCTGRSKAVFKQLQANPAVEICTVQQDMSWIRVSGKVELDDNHTVKERILAEQPLIKGIYGSADNPEFTTFCIAHGTYTIADFSANPPHTEAF